MSNSLSSCISNTSEKFSRTPEVSFSKMLSKPRMFFKKFKGTVSLKQLQSQTNTHCRRKFNKKVDVVSRDMQFINFTTSFVSNLPKKKLTIHFEPIEFKGVLGVFNFPHKVESVLSEAMLPGFQIHFLSSAKSGDTAHANFANFFSGGLVSRPSEINSLKELNLMEHGSPSLLESRGIRA